MELSYKFEVFVKCDSMHMVEAFTNIFKNATEAAPKGGSIRLEVYGTRKLLNIAISDNGIGIKKEYQSKIFEPFFTTKRTDENFGLGLSYCFNVMQRHNCDLSLYSQEGRGTTFFICFPAFRIMKFDDKIPEGSKYVGKN